MRIRYFIRTSSLLQQTEFKADNLIKLQGVTSKIITLDNYVEDKDIGKFTVSSIAVS